MCRQSGPTKDVFPFVPVVILGAGRSGTNALRDMLNVLPDFATWPCDEIDPIWRHGNLQWPNDELPDDRATPKVTKFIRRAFLRQWMKSGKPPYLIEKTCANTLRVGFVNCILPEAQFIHIIRDGADVVPSAKKRWGGDLEVRSLPYFLRKARFIPISDVPYFGFRFLKNRISMYFGKKRRLSTWGPRFNGIEGYRDAELLDVCGAQWAMCVSKCDAGLASISSDRILRLQYEDMTADPEAALRSILSFLDPKADPEAYCEGSLKKAAATIRRASGVKTVRKALNITPSTREMMMPVLETYGYGQDST